MGMLRVTKIKIVFDGAVLWFGSVNSNVVLEEK